MSMITKVSLRGLVFYGLVLFITIYQFGCLSHDPPPVIALIGTLKNGDYQARVEALEKIKNLGPEAKPAIPTLIQCLEDKDSTIRSGAAVALGTIGSDAKTAIPVLITKLKDKDRFVRGASAKALAGIGVKEDKTLSALQKALDDPDADFRMDVAEALAALDPESQAALLAIIKVLQTDKEPGNRGSAALQLGKIKSTRIKSAIPALIAALKDEDDDVRGNVAQTLGNICEEAATVVPALIERLNQSELVSVRIQAAQALGEFGPEAKAAIPTLNRSLKDPDDDVRVLAAQSLEQIKTWRTKRGRNGKEEQAKKILKKRKGKEKSAMLELDDPESTAGQSHLEVVLGQGVALLSFSYFC